MSGGVPSAADSPAWGPGNGRTSSADSRMIMLIRHAEKPMHTAGSPRGVNPEGLQDSHSLTVTGWVRAGALVELFAPSRGEPFRRRCADPTPFTVLLTPVPTANARSRRSAHWLPVSASWSSPDSRPARRSISCARSAAGPAPPSSPGTTRPSTRSPTTWARSTPTPPGHWPHDRFDMIWTFTPGQHGWRFAQIPQLLLPGDLPYPIQPTPSTPP